MLKMMKKSLKISKGVIFIIIGLLLFYADYRLTLENFNFPDMSFAKYLDVFTNDWHTLTMFLFILLGIIEIGGAFIDGN